jgi:hypothetical protein
MLFTPSYNPANYRQITEHWQWVSSELSSQGLNRLWEFDSHHSDIGMQQIDAWVSLLVIMIFLLRAPYDSHITCMRNNNHGWHQMWISSHRDVAFNLGIWQREPLFQNMCSIVNYCPNWIDTCSIILCFFRHLPLKPFDLVATNIFQWKKILSPLKSDFTNSMHIETSTTFCFGFPVWML